MSSPDDSYARSFESLLGVPFTHGNSIERLLNGNAIFPAMLDAIAQAESTIEFLTFVYWTGDIADRVAGALAERAHAGVRVRVLLDAIGSAQMRAELTERMESAGVEVRHFRPPSWRFWETLHRTHRKVLVCDDQIGFTGGVGIAEEWEGDASGPHEWRDTHFRIEGPAVSGLRAAFYGNWIEEVDIERDDLIATDHAMPGEARVQVVRSTASYAWSDAALVLRACLLAARRSIDLTTAYFVPGEASVRALCAAAERGVRVRVLIPGPYADQRVVRVASQDVYAPLLEAGVEIWNYQRSMLHAKVMTIDGVLATVGSSNFNQRSMSQDDEVCVQVLDRDFVGTLDRDFENDLADSVRIDLTRWRRRDGFQRLKELATRTVRRQL